VILFPVIAYLVFIEFRKDWQIRRLQVLTAALLPTLIWVGSALGRAPYWGPRGGGLRNLWPLLIDSPLSYFSTWIGLFGSPTKGFFVYCPVLLLSLYAVPQAFRVNRRIAIFALLVVACISNEMALLHYPFDEVWGTRYLHATIAPLMLVIGATRPQFEWRRETPLLALTALGVVISVLGALFYYGLREAAAAKVTQNTAEWLTGDTDWNQIRFHERLLHVWLNGNGPAPWTAYHLWLWSAPPGAQPWQTVDLRPFAVPQSFLLRFWRTPKQGGVLLFFGFYLGLLIGGVLLLGWAVWRTIQENRLGRGQPAGVIEASATPLEVAR
jgi:hypothetical protein